MKTSFEALPLFLFVLFLLGCQYDSCENDGCSSKKVLKEEEFDINEEALMMQKFLGDELAQKAYHRINQNLRSGAKIGMSLYQFDNPDINTLINHNAKAYQLTKSPVIEMDKYVVSRGDQYECSWNINSLYEYCHDMDVFEASPGVSKKHIMSDDEYLKIANQWMKNVIQLALPDNYKLYPYKRKYGINGTASIDRPDDIIETIYDVGISFASTLDGWPVIGPGGKVYIHLTPDGKPVATKVYRKVPGKVIATIPDRDIKTADEALEELVKERDYNLDEYKITRAEFGYFYWGKNSIQNLISPYYVFFLAPADSQFTTEVFEIVSAVKGKYEKMIKADYELDVKRKKEQLQFDVSDTPKKYVAY